MSLQSRLESRGPSQMADMMAAIEQRRCKMLLLSPDEVVAMFNVAFNRPRLLKVPVFELLPDGYFVDGIYPEARSNQFYVRVFHPSFAADDVTVYARPEVARLNTVVIKFAEASIRDEVQEAYGI